MLALALLAALRRRGLRRSEAAKVDVEYVALGDSYTSGAGLSDAA